MPLIFPAVIMGKSEKKHRFSWIHNQEYCLTHCDYVMCQIILVLLVLMYTIQQLKSYACLRNSLDNVYGLKALYKASIFIRYTNILCVHA